MKIRAFRSCARYIIQGPPEPINPAQTQIHVSKIECEGRVVWFTSRMRMPSEEEMAEWIPRYREEALSRGPREPLVIDVEREGLRP
jgi:hypothetical protein